ncbi:hypothetical protein BC835DRAFT_1416374 [Cytidiella melzeri]|nr:hypothetical protein BC835DRAFT_1416374 [Cytidiella melzeri]
MASAPYKFGTEKREVATEFVGKCYRWLAAAGGDIVGYATSYVLRRAVTSISAYPSVAKLNSGNTSTDLPKNIYSTQNWLVPTNRLAPELLGTIFQHLNEYHTLVDTNLPLQPRCHVLPVAKTAIGSLSPKSYRFAHAGSVELY